MILSNDKIFVACGSLFDSWNGFQVIDISQKEADIVLQYSVPCYVSSVFVDGDYAYIACLRELIILDIKDIYKPDFCSSIDISGRIEDVYVYNEKAYLVDNTSGLRIVDISNKGKLQVIGETSIQGNPCSVHVKDNYAYLLDSIYGLSIINIQHPVYYQLLSSVNSIGDIYKLSIDNDMAYVLSAEKGLNVIDISNPKKPVIKSILSLRQTIFNNIEYLDQYVYAVCENLLYIINVTNPENPIIKSELHLGSYTANCIAVKDSRLYVPYEHSGINVYDISDKSSPQLIDFINIPGLLWDIEIINDKLFLANVNSGVQIVDIKDIHNPILIKTVGLPGLTYSVEILDGYAYAANYNSGLQIVDISNLHEPEIVASFQIPNAIHIIIKDKIAYLIGHSQKKISAVDIIDPLNPALIGSIEVPGFAWDTEIIDGIAYIASVNYGFIVVPVPIKSLSTSFDSDILVNFPSPRMPGHYTLRAFNQNEYFEIPGALSFIPPEESYVLNTKAIIVAGTQEDDNIKVQINTLSDKAYETLLYQGYTSESIYYMNPTENYKNADALSSKKNLDYAINEWAKESPNASELIVYFVDHGSNDIFHINKGETINNTTLGIWFDNLQNELSIHLIFIYDACKSGSFIDLYPPLNSERIIITSSLKDKDITILENGNISFSYYFWDSIYKGFELDKAYYQAKNSMQDYQTVQIEADGVGKPDQITDYELILNKKLRRGYTPKIQSPYIYQTSKSQVLYDDNSAEIWAGVSYVDDKSEIRRVWAVINSPNDSSKSSDIAITELPTCALIDENGDGIYRGVYNNFNSNGVYAINIYAMNEKGVYSLPKRVTITKTNLIQSVCESQTLSGINSSSAKLWAQVSCNSDYESISSVWAEILLPDNSMHSLDLIDVNDDCLYEGTFDNFTQEFVYEIEIFVMNSKGFSSSKKTDVIRQDIYDDIYENDNDKANATVISISNKAYTHYFSKEDIDWVKFYPIPDIDYTIEIESENLTYCNPILNIFDLNGIQINFQYETQIDNQKKIDVRFNDDSTYFFKLTNDKKNYFGRKYSIKIYKPNAGDEGYLIGKVINAVSKKPIPNAKIRTKTGSGLTKNDGSFILSDSASSYTMTTVAFGYLMAETSVVIKAGEIESLENIEIFPGDYNNDDSIDLNDIIILLQVLSGMNINNILSYDSMCDTIGNSMIGHEDLIHLIKLISTNDCINK